MPIARFLLASLNALTCRDPGVAERDGGRYRSAS
jgi:hypothetical protein